MMVMIMMASVISMTVENPPRQEPRIPAIFCSCGVFAEPEVSLPYQLARLSSVEKSQTVSEKMLKSRSWLTS